MSTPSWEGGCSTPFARRQLLGLFLGAGIAWGQRGLAARRPPYGGKVHIALPLSVARLDPHDPSDLTATLLGSAVFDSLFAESGGKAYPALAAGLPEAVQGKVRIRLREGMRFSSGRPLTAADAAFSLQRSQALSSVLGLLQKPRAVSGETLVEFTTPLPLDKVAQVLSSPFSAIVPRGFSPTTPEGCGAFSAQPGKTVLSLRHNPMAPRGGSMLDQIDIERATVSQSLRAFEATKSIFSLLGPGLYQARKGAQRLDLAPLGYVALVPHPSWRGVTRPGELHALLSYLPEAPFAGLGVVRPRVSARKWGGAPFSILVDKNNPLFLELAQEIKTAWARRPSDIDIVARSWEEIERTTTGFDAKLVGVSASLGSEEAITRCLFSLDGKVPPRAGRIPPPDEAARQLRLGLVGSLVPRASASREIGGLVQSRRLTLEQATWENARKS